MRSRHRVPFCFLTSVGLLAAFVAGACSSGAIGIDACREIEGARCAALTACGKTEEEAAYCADFYRDQCLHGITSGVEPSEVATTACVDAVRAVETCARAGAATMTECSAVKVIEGVDASAISPCTILTSAAEKLDACSFVSPTTTEDAGTTPTSDGDAGDTSDAGGDATID